MKKLGLLILLSFVLISSSYSQIGITVGTGATQTFDSFAGTLITMPANWTFSWTDFTPGGFYSRSNTYSNTNSIYGLRDTPSSTDIAIGGKMGAGEGPFNLTAHFRNVGATTITSLQFNWDVKQFSRGLRATQVSFSWSTDNVTYNLNNATGSGVTPVVAITGTDANLPSVSTTIQSILISQNIPPNGDIYLRFTWTTGAGSGNNGHIGIDNFMMDAPMPVELTSFSATTIGKDVKLSWNTSTEVNNYGFEVERSVVKGEWNKIGFVNGSGNSNSPKDYSFVDDKVVAGKYSYRLKQFDNDGQFEYSKVIEIDVNGTKKFELTQNYPNPFNPTTTIQFQLPQAGMVKLTLYNILGQEIRTLVNETKEAGTHTVNFDASELNSGVYIYKIESGSFTQTKKMTLVK